MLGVRVKRKENFFSIHAAELVELKTPSFTTQKCQAQQSREMRTFFLNPYPCDRIQALSNTTRKHWAQQSRETRAFYFFNQRDRINLAANPKLTTQKRWAQQSRETKTFFFLIHATKSVLLQTPSFKTLKRCAQLCIL